MPSLGILERPATTTTTATAMATFTVTALIAATPTRIHGTRLLTTQAIFAPIWTKVREIWTENPQIAIVRLEAPAAAILWLRVRGLSKFREMCISSDAAGVLCTSLFTLSAVK